MVIEAIDAMDWDEPGSGDEDRERFRIQNDSQAVWAMRKLASAKARLHDISLIAEAEIDRIQHWAEQQSREPMRDATYFEGILMEYGRAQREEGRKTVSTPYGAVKSRIGRSRYTFSDKQGFIEWARQHRPEWVAVKEEPSLSALHDANVQGSADPETGEVIPGLEVDPPQVTFSVEVEK